MSEWSFPEVSFLGSRLHPVGETDVIAAVDRAIATRQTLTHAALNAAKAVRVARDAGFRALLNSFDLVTADGMSVVWAARLLGMPRCERIAGIDLMQHLLARAEKQGHRVYFLGATDEVLQAMLASLRRRFPDLQVAGTRHGYFSREQDPEVAAQVAAAAADILFVGTPTPKKELFLAENRHRLGVPFAMGVGGTFDVLAGQARRAPESLQRLGLEWAFRLAQEPRRLWRRYLISNSVFIYLVLRARLGRSPVARGL